MRVCVWEFVYSLVALFFVFSLWHTILSIVKLPCLFLLSFQCEITPKYDVRCVLRFCVAALRLITFLYCNSSDLNPLGHLRNRQCAGHGVRLGVIENENVEHASNWLWHACYKHNSKTNMKKKKKRVLDCWNPIQLKLIWIQWIYAAYKTFANRFSSPIRRHSWHTHTILTNTNVASLFILAIIYNWSEIYVHYRRLLSVV